MLHKYINIYIYMIATKKDSKFKPLHSWFSVANFYFKNVKKKHSVSLFSQKLIILYIKVYKKKIYIYC